MAKTITYEDLEHMSEQDLWILMDLVKFAIKTRDEQ